MIQNELTYKTDSQTQRRNLSLPGRRMRGRESQGVWNGHVHTAIFGMDNQQGPTVQHRGICSMLCGNQDGRGVWGRMHTYIYMAKSLPCSPGTITHCQWGIPQYTIKSLLKNHIREGHMCGGTCLSKYSNRSRREWAEDSSKEFSVTVHCCFL